MPGERLSDLLSLDSYHKNMYYNLLDKQGKVIATSESRATLRRKRRKLGDRSLEITIASATEAETTSPKESKRKARNEERKIKKGKLKLYSKIPTKLYSK